MPLVALGASPLAHASPPQSDEPLLERLEVVAPAAPGGGWDQTALAMERALESAGLVADVVVTHSPGAGGSIALAQLLSGRHGDANVLLVSGHVMVSALHANRATVSLLEATPIARLTGEYQVIAVPGASDLRSLEDLVRVLRSEPGAISWAGGSEGGTDHLLVTLLARAVGVAPASVSYLSFPGGGEAAKALVESRVAAGVSGYGEFAPLIRAGRLRPLAVSGERRLPGVAIPTLKERGIDLSLLNWRGVFAPPGLAESERARLESLLAEMAASAAWRGLLADHHWTDLYLGAPAFAQFVREEAARAAARPDMRVADPAETGPRLLWIVSRTGLVLITVVLTAALLLAALLLRQRRLAHRREEALEHDIEELRHHLDEARHRFSHLMDEIEHQFEEWSLTAAEREVALLMLKGLRHKEIASIRQTSERTVRQQALSIYKKGGLEGRTDLAAYFLEDLITPNDARLA